MQFSSSSMPTTATSSPPMYISSATEYTFSLLKLQVQIQTIEKPNKNHKATKENKIIYSTAMIDSGSSGDFISTAFVKRYQLSIIPLQPSRTVYLADGSQHVCNQQAVCNV